MEDCSQSHGAKLGNKYVGSFGDVSVWSFCSDKIISTGGEGGMISTNSQKIYKKIWSLKEIGKDLHKSQIKKTGFNWCHDFFGTNLRLTEMQAALGILQLKKLDFNLKKRNAANSLIWDSLKKFKSIKIPRVDNSITLAPYRCYIHLNFNYIKKEWNLKKIVRELNLKNISCNYGSCSEIYLEKAFKKSNYKITKRLPNAKKLSETSVAFIINQNMSKNYIKNNILIITKIIAAFTKK